MMKRLLLPLALVALLAVNPAVAQPSSSASVQVTPSAPAPQPLTKFTLDFPGGTPGQLVAAIEKASGKPVNLVFSAEAARVAIPALKMSNVDVQQLFTALNAIGSSTTTTVAEGGPVRWGVVPPPQPANDDSVWTLFTQPDLMRQTRPAEPAQFFLLTPYLERGLTVDDITTAIETAWKMQGHNSGAALKYHKETNLLIAVGGPADIAAIHSALAALASGGPREEHANGKAAAPKKP